MVRAPELEAAERDDWDYNIVPSVFFRPAKLDTITRTAEHV
jgi:hypothetical protein